MLDTCYAEQVFMILRKKRELGKKNYELPPPPTNWNLIKGHKAGAYLEVLHGVIFLEVFMSLSRLYTQSHGMKFPGARWLNHIFRLSLLSTWQITKLQQCCDVDADDDDDDGWPLELRRCWRWQRDSGGSGGSQICINR